MHERVDGKVGEDGAAGRRGPCTARSLLDPAMMVRCICSKVGEIPRWVGVFLGYFGYIVRQSLSVAQALALLLTALLATDFFILTPNVTARVTGLEDRVNDQAVESAYENKPPAVVTQTLSALDDLSFSRSSQDLYPLTDLCRSSEETVDELYPHACSPGSTTAVPFFDRVLLSVNQRSESEMRLDQNGLQQAHTSLAGAEFERARVTILNNGKSTAQNVIVTHPDSYKLKNPPEQTSIGAGQHLDLVYESTPVALSPASAAEIDNPVFLAKYDPTGPVDPAIIKAAFYVSLGLFVLVLLSAATGAKEALKRGAEASVEPGLSG